MTDNLVKPHPGAGISDAVPHDMHEVLVETEGEFAGWQTFRDVPFNRHVGPFYHRPVPGGAICAFRPSAKNANGVDLVHGGALLAFADFSMFAAAQYHYRSRNVVTVTVASEFLGAVRPADYVEARTEVVSASGSLIFVRGLMTSDKRPILNYSGTFKRLLSK